MTRGGGQKIGNWGDVIYGGPLCFKTGLNEDQLYHAKKQSYGVWKKSVISNCLNWSLEQFCDRVTTSSACNNLAIIQSDVWLWVSTYFTITV